MLWEDTPFVKLYQGDGPWMDISLEARGLFYELMRHVDRSGILRCAPDHCRTIARVVNADLKSVRNYMAELEADGCVTLGNGCVTLKNFVEAQASRTSNKLRQAQYRERARDRALAKDENPATPENDATERNAEVTPCSNADVTPSNADVTTRLDQTRLDQLLPGSDAPGVQPELPLELTSPETPRPKKKNEKTPAPTSDLLAVLVGCSRFKLPSPPERSHRGMLADMLKIEGYSNLGRWRVLVAWVDAGGGWPRDIDLGRLRTQITTWLPQAEEWDAAGRPPLDTQTRAKGPSSALCWGDA